METLNKKHRQNIFIAFLDRAKPAELTVSSATLLLCCITWLATSCSDDYLDDTENQKTMYSSRGIYITPSSGYMEYNVTVPDAGDNAYTIGLLPKWLEFKYLKGNFKDNNVTLKFTVHNVSASFAPGVYAGSLALVIEDIGIYTIPVHLSIE